MALDTGNRWLLTVTASYVLYEAHNSTITSKSSRNEMDFVWSLTGFAPHMFYALWGPILNSSGIDLRVTGVYCHQTPKACFEYDGSRRPCELGDLLIVHEHLGSVPRRRALLVQAKMAKHRRPTASPNTIQDHLYSKWPNFSLSGRGGQHKKSYYKRGDRNVRPNVSGSRYLLIENERKPCSFSDGLLPNVFTFIKSNNSSTHTPIDGSILLSNMVLGKSGSGRKSDILSSNDMSHPRDSDYIAPRNNKRRHWSITVQELLEITATKVAPKNVSKEGVYRGQNASWVQVGRITNSAISGNLFTGRGTGEFDTEFEPPEGISLLLIETSGEDI